MFKFEVLSVCGDHILCLNVGLLIYFISLACSLDVEYMDSACGSTKSFSKSLQLESSTALTYKNLLNCTTTATVPTGYFVVAIITRFELEPASSGGCKDYLDVYDGPDLTSVKIASELCGSGSSIPNNFTSSGTSILFRLITDNSARYRGFNFILVAAKHEPCSSGQFRCNTSVCIDSSLACDSYNHCGDSSDEQNCSDEASEDDNLILIVVVAGSVFVLLLTVGAIVFYRIHSRRKWKKLLNSHTEADDTIIPPGSSYPVTHKYYTGLRVNAAT